MKRAICVIAVLSMLAGWSAPPAVAASPAPKPKVVIEDPVSDANFINDQGTGDGSFGDFVTPADVSSVTDLIEVSFANDSKNLYITIRTEAAPPAAQGTGWRVRVNPDGAGGTYCLLFEVFFPGAGNALAAPEARLVDMCSGGEVTPVEILGTMFSVPRNVHESFGKGASLTAPQAQGFIYLGSSPPGGLAAPTADTTVPGTDYKFVDKKR